MFLTEILEKAVQKGAPKLKTVNKIRENPHKIINRFKNAAKIQLIIYSAMNLLIFLYFPFEHSLMLNITDSRVNPCAKKN